MIIQEIRLEYFLIIGTMLFCIGVIGILLNNKNIITVILSIELMILAVNINFIAASYFLKEISGQIFTIFIVTNIASESAIGLALVLNYFHYRNSIQIEDFNTLKE